MLNDKYFLLLQKSRFLLVDLNKELMNNCYLRHLPAERLHIFLHEVQNPKIVLLAVFRNSKDSIDTLYQLRLRLLLEITLVPHCSECFYLLILWLNLLSYATTLHEFTGPFTMISLNPPSALIQYLFPCC